MSSATTTLKGRVEFVQKRTQGKIGEYVWDILNGESPKVFHPDELKPAFMSRPRQMAMVTLWNHEQRQSFAQLTLLIKAAKHERQQGMSERGFKAHADSLIKNLGPAFVVYSLKCFKGSWSYIIACVFNQNQVEHTVASYDGVHKEEGYWFALSKQLQVIPPGGQTDANFWKFHQELVLPQSHIETLVAGNPVFVGHKWVESVPPRSVMHLTVNGGRSPDYNLAATTEL